LLGYCDFENGLCGWTNKRKLDQLDFMRHRGKTPSVDTGPEYDHTYGTANGNISLPFIPTFETILGFIYSDTPDITCWSHSIYWQRRFLEVNAMEHIQYSLEPRIKQGSCLIKPSQYLLKNDRAAILTEIDNSIL
jgi:hypothetical protein